MTQKSVKSTTHGCDAVLEGVSAPLLVRFLRPYDDFLERGGLRVPESIDRRWITSFAALLARPDVPNELADALYQIEALVDDDSHDALLSHPDATQLNLFATSRRLSAVDLAFTIYLDHRELFVDVESRAHSKNVTRFLEFTHADSEIAPQLGSKMRQARLEERLREWFASRNRTRYVELHLLETTGEFNFHIIHGRLERRHDIITPDEHARESLTYIPGKKDLVIYDPEAKKLSINAQFPIENNFYRRAIGDVYFGDAEHFQPRSVFTGVPLQEEGLAALSPDGIEGLKGVALRELVIEQGDRTRVSFGGPNLEKTLTSSLERELICAGVIAKMQFALEIVGRARPLRLDVCLPNKLTYDRRIAPSVVRTFLRKRGFRAVESRRA
jgi:hypothetical protein